MRSILVASTTEPPESGAQSVRTYKIFESGLEIPMAVFEARKVEPAPRQQVDDLFPPPRGFGRKQHATFKIAKKSHQCLGWIVVSRFNPDRGRKFGAEIRSVVADFVGHRGGVEGLIEPVLRDGRAEAGGFIIDVIVRKGRADLVEEGANGYSFEPTDHSALADLMEGYITNRDLIEEHGTRSLRLVAPYTPDRAASVARDRLAGRAAPRTHRTPLLPRCRSAGSI